MTLLHFYRNPALSKTRTDALLAFARKRLSPRIRGIETELCFNVETSAPLSPAEIETLRWLLSETFEPDRFAPRAFLGPDRVVEVGPRMNFATAWSANAVSVCQACGLTKVNRIERSRRYR